MKWSKRCRYSIWSPRRPAPGQAAELRPSLHFRPTLDLRLRRRPVLPHPPRSGPIHPRFALRRRLKPVLLIHPRFALRRRLKSVLLIHPQFALRRRLKPVLRSQPWIALLSQLKLVQPCRLGRQCQPRLALRFHPRPTFALHLLMAHHRLGPRCRLQCLRSIRPRSIRPR